MRVDGSQTPQEPRTHHSHPHSGAKFGVDDAASGSGSSPAASSTALSLVSPAAQAALLNWQAEMPEGVSATAPGDGTISGHT